MLSTLHPLPLLQALVYYRRPLRQTSCSVMIVLLFDVVFEAIETIDISIVEIVDTDIKRELESVTEMSFQCLWLNFHFEEPLLLPAVPAIRFIPIAVIIKQAS